VWKPAILCVVLVLVESVRWSFAQTTDDPTVRAAVERYYRALEAEDVDAYLSLWSSSGQRPQPASVKFMFEAVDERFLDIEVLRAVMSGDRLRVRVSLRRERTSRPRTPGGSPQVLSTVSRAALTFVREADDWKVVSEGTPESDLAAAYVAAATADDREALLAAEPDLVNRLLVVSVARIASQAVALRQFARAENLYERVLELAQRIGSQQEEAEALQNLGNVLYFQRKFPQALAAYERRLAVEWARADDAGIASALVGMATVHYSLAEYTAAFSRYRQGLAIQERLHDLPSVASTLISTGNVRYLQGDYPGAIRDYSRSRELYRGMSNTDGDARALQGLGRTFLAQGDLAGALTAFAGVLAEGRARSDRARQGTATQSIGDVHLRLGNIDAARSHYEESRDHFLATKDAASAGRVWQGLGMTELIAGRFDAAEKAYGTSRALCGTAGDAECGAHATVGLAFAQSAQEKYPEAIASYRNAIEAFNDLGSREAAARAEVGLSQALAGASDFAAAIEASTRARHIAVGLGLDDVLWRALTAEARAVRKSGDSKTALAIGRAAAGVVERMHAEALEKPATAIPSDASSVFATLAVLQAENADPASAVLAATRMRSVDLRRTLAVNEREIARGLTLEERERERAAAAELLSLFAQANRERAMRKPDKARLVDFDERIATASASRKAWMDQLFARVPDLRLWRGLEPAPAEDRVLAILSPGTVMLDFIVDEESVLVNVSSAMPNVRTTVHVTPLRRQALAERVHALLQAGALRDQVAWRKVALEIARVLPPDLPALIASASRIIVLPHDLLWRIPFEALPLGDGHLGDGAQVIYAGSRAALVRAVESAPGPVKTMVGISAPQLSPVARSHLQQTAPGWTLRAPEAASRESASVADVYGENSVVLSGAEATESGFRAKAPAASALHIAAPFRINGASPLFSPLVLVGEPAVESPDDNGALEVREVMNLDLRARVAVFTDGTATSMRDGAAAADIVQWAWLAAGVPSVLIARWTSEAAASDALLAEFHRRLRAGLEPADALHAARATVRARPEWAAPYYWAGWMLMGTPHASSLAWTLRFAWYLRP
jgi:tetratricopeptide (TPR) repeat protein